MVQKGGNELDMSGSKPAYMYYLMTKSGQCSPTTSDTLDSGTGSDLETNSNHGNGTPPSIKTAVGKTIQKFTVHDAADRVKLAKRSISNNESYHTDSEESESSLSCDSLNSGESGRLKGNSVNGTIITSSISNNPFMVRSSVAQSKPTNANGGNSSNRIFTSDENNITKISFLPHSLLRDIRDRSANVSSIKLNGSDECDNTTTNAISRFQQINSSSNDNNNTNSNFNNNNNSNDRLNVEKFSAITLEDSNNSETKINRFPLKRSPFHRNDKKLSENKCYENDKYISFHINECVLDVIKEHPSKNTSSNEDDSFAGYRDIRAPSSASSAIRSSKGTIRGVKNRVRNGIATFLQMQQTNIKVSYYDALIDYMWLFIIA